MNRGFTVCLDTDIRQAWWGVVFGVSKGLHASAKMKNVLPRTVHLSIE